MSESDTAVTEDAFDKEFKKWAKEQVAFWKRVDESVSRDLSSSNFDVFDYMLRNPEEFDEAIQEADKFASQEDTAFTAGVLPKIIKEYGFSPDEHSIEDIVEAFVLDEVIARGDGRHQLQVELAAESLGFGYDSFYSFDDGVLLQGYHTISSSL